MFKYNGGSVTNPKTGVTKDIVVKLVHTNKLSETLIGCGIVLAGIAYLTTTAYKNGAKAFNDTELQILSDCGLLDQEQL